MTIAAAGKGSLTVTVDASSPSYTTAAGGTTGVTTGVIKVHATNEAVNLTKLGLVLTAGTSPSSGDSSSDMTQVYLYNGATLVGTATFTGTNTVATSTILNNGVTVPKDSDLRLTVKADLAGIGIGLSGTSGDIIMIDPNSAEGSGASSGSTIQSGATVGVAGVRLFRTFPSLSLDTLGSTGVGDGRLIRFKVSASSGGDVNISKFVLTVATTTLSITNIGLYGYQDAGYTSPISDNVGAGSGEIDTLLATTSGTVDSDGRNGPCGPTDTALSFCNADSGKTTLVYFTKTNSVQIPAGGSRWFELRGAISGNGTGASATTILLADTAVATGTAASLKTNTNSTGYNLVWTPNSTTTPAITNDNDWVTGYLGTSGTFPTSGLIQTRGN
jgi:hypothetical protein